MRGMILGIVVALGVGGYLMTQPVFQGGVPEPRAFDASVWQDEVQVYAQPEPRLAMVADLRENFLQVGMSQEAILALLGPATETDKFADRGLVYWLGPEPSGNSIDYAWLA